MLDDGVVRYLSWEECTKREDEVQGVKKDVTWKPNSQGLVTEVRSDRAVPADLSSDLLLRYAPQRRSAALDMGGLCSFEAHEALAEYMRPPPHGFARLSLAQLERADREVFTRLAESTRAGLRLDQTGQLPLTQLFRTCLDAPAVQLLLTNLPGSAAHAARQSKSEPSKKRRSSPSPPRRSNNTAAPSKKSKKPASRPRESFPMPTGLQGKAAQTPDGRRLCFGFNLGTCTAKAKAGGQCPRGWHLCANHGCFGKHPVSKCTQ
jgi:hypothetical protein